MSESQKTRFLDGLRVTPLHLNHLLSSGALYIVFVGAVIVAALNGATSA